MVDSLATLSKAGVSIWLDDLSRERLGPAAWPTWLPTTTSWRVITNPSIFAKAITGAEAYHPQLRDLAARGVDVREALRALTTFDVRWALMSCGRSRRLLHSTPSQVFSAHQWAALQAAGARPQRPLWASTSVKDPAYPDTRYVVELVAPGVVADQVPANSVHGHYEESQQVFDQLRGLGIDYDDVVQKLEDDGVAAFDGAWERLGGQLATTLRAQPARQ